MYFKHLNIILVNKIKDKYYFKLKIILNYFYILKLNSMFKIVCLIRNKMTKITVLDNIINYKL